MKNGSKSRDDDFSLFFYYCDEDEEECHIGKDAHEDDRRVEC